MQETATEVAKDVIIRSFETSPDTVYGLLIGFLVIMLGLTFWLRERDRRKMSDTIINLKLATLESLKDMNQSLVLLQQSQNQNSNRILEELDKAHERILERFKEINQIQ